MGGVYFISEKVVEIKYGELLKKFCEVSGSMIRATVSYPFILL